MFKRSIPLFLLFAIVAASACVSQQPPNQTSYPQPPGNSGQEMPPQPPATGVKEFAMIISHTSYSPDKFTVNKGDTVRFLANAAKGTGAQSGFDHNHGITIDEFDVNQAVPTEVGNPPVVIQFVADKAGEFRIYCKTCLDGPFGANHPAIQATLVVNG